MLGRYRELFEWERDCNAKMLAMIESVPADARVDPKFQRAVVLADHVALCRTNWLARMTDPAAQVSNWQNDLAKPEELRQIFAHMERLWEEYLVRLTEQEVESDFEFIGTDGKTPFRWSIKGQMEQLVGHACYHRGQIALLVELLGGETEDTDYLFWRYRRDPKYGAITS
ncbi:MAG: hypothetical protein JSS72_11810 [Armatimonadetes bacterium]|nr:hypothetical protein [Armatimonadota bacterium]